MDARRTMKRAAGWLLAHRWILWTLAAAVALLMGCVAVYLAWQGLRLLTSENLEASDTGAGIQGLAAAVNLLATLCLVGVTTAYAFIAYKHLRLSGPDVSMDWHLAWADPTGSSGLLAKADISSRRDGPTADGHTLCFVAVKLINSGNQAVMIEQAHLVVDDNLAYTYLGSVLSPPCPVQLDAHSSRTLYFDPDDVDGLLRLSEHLSTPEPHELHASVNLGSGSNLSTARVPLQCFKLNPH